MHEAGVDVGGDDRRLGDDDAPAGHVHERVRGAEIDRHVVDAERGRQMAPGDVATGAVSTKPDTKRVADPGSARRVRQRGCRDRSRAHDRRRP